MKLTIAALAAFLAFSGPPEKESRVDALEEKIAVLCERIQDLEAELGKTGFKPRVEFRMTRCREPGR